MKEEARRVATMAPLMSPVRTPTPSPTMTAPKAPRPHLVIAITTRPLTSV
jgi:hypothetical protein